MAAFNTVVVNALSFNPITIFQGKVIYQFAYSGLCHYFFFSISVTVLCLKFYKRFLIQFVIKVAGNSSSKSCQYLNLDKPNFQKIDDFAKLNCMLYTKNTAVCCIFALYWIVWIISGIESRKLLYFVAIWLNKILIAQISAPFLYR